MSEHNDAGIVRGIIKRRNSLMPAVLLLCAIATPSLAQTYANTLIAQIHNALGWATSHAYSVGDRANWGPGWTPTGTPTAINSGTYTSGSAIYAWQATVAGTSASSGGGPAISGSCAASTAVIDGSVTWKCLSQTDYPSLNTYLSDAALWAPSTAINGYESRRSGEMVYDADGSACVIGSASLCSCTTGLIAPTGTSYPIADGTCSWVAAGASQYQNSASIPGYSSERLVGGVGLLIPHKTNSVAACTAGYCGLACSAVCYTPVAVMMNGLYEAVLWNDRPLNASTEAFPFKYDMHTGQCDGGGEDPTYPPSCNTNGQIITAAPGECFCDHGTSQPLAFNTANGVSMEDSSAYNLYSQYIISSYDCCVYTTRLQMKSDNSTPLEAVSGSSVTGMLLEGAVQAVLMDGGVTLTNNVLISHGEVAISGKYSNFIVNNTIVGLGGSGVVAYDAYATACGYLGCGQITFYNNTITGFTYDFACVQYTNGPPPDYIPGCDSGGGSPPGDPNSASAGNTTDVASVYTPTNVTLSAFYGTITLQVKPVPGTTYGISASSAFVNSTSDFRLKSGSPLIGAGVNVVSTYPAMATDIYGTARPQSTGYAVGAWQDIGTNAPVGPGMLRRR
jgi:hypothetical protein